MIFEGCAQNAGLGDASLLALISAKADQNRTPLNVHFELTYRCNEQCVHCYCVVEHGREQEVRRRELTLDEICRVLDELADMGALYLTLSGGEVMVRPDFFDIAEHARRRGFAYRVFTNGIGLTEAKVERLAALEPLTVELSIFSADPEVHDRITRVPGSFKRLMAAIERLQHHGLRVYLKTVVMKPNVDGLAELDRLGRDLGVFTHTYSCEVSPRIDGAVPRDGHIPQEYQLDADELFRYLRDSTWSEQLDPQEGRPEDVARQRGTCGPATNGCCIDPYGNVFPCVAFRVPIGNVRQTSFRELWMAPPPAIRDLLSVQRYADLPECSSCELVGFCNRCHGDNRLERGEGEWKRCHERARTLAGAQRRLYQIRTAGRS
jgi:radical SAM protein with 4Fe4S-binding SPASM domain